VRILVPGYISSRKNPHWIVEACELLRSQGYGNFTLAFDGIIASDQIDYLMSKKSDWLSVHDGYKTLENFKASLRDAHLVLLPYNNRGSSGIVIHSLLMGNYVAISKSRAWKNLSRTSRGKLKLMCHSSEGVYIATKEWLDLEYKNYDSLDPFSEGKVSVIDFLTQKSTKEPGS
jgi:hypothetical protein